MRANGSKRPRRRASRLCRGAGLWLGLALALASLPAAPGRAALDAETEAEAHPEVVTPEPTTEALVPSAGRSTIVLPPVASEDDVLRTLDLELGKSVLVRTEYAIQRVSVGDPEVLRVVVLSPRELQFVPNQIGATNVVLFDVEGEPQAAIDIQVGTTHASLERQLRRVIGIDDIYVESAGEAVVLRGTVPSPVAAERAVAVARAFFQDEEDPEDHVVNVLEVGGNQQVMIEVILAEMTRGTMRNLTSNFATVIQSGDQTFRFFQLIDGLSSLADGLSGGDELLVTERANLFGQFVNGDSFALTALFEVLEENNLTKILAEPILIARSGQAASFLVGGEIPIPVAQDLDTISIEFKEFGVGVAFTPVVLGPDRIHLQVSPEVSEPDFNLGLEAAGFTTPGYITRRASTSVELGDGQSFAIAGLLDERVRETVRKYPILGDIPILGALFRSTRFQKDETDLVIIVTPRLVKPLPPGPPPLPTDTFIEPSAFEFFLLGALEGGVPDPGGPGGLIGPAGHRVPGEIGVIEP